MSDIVTTEKVQVGIRYPNGRIEWAKMGKSSSSAPDTQKLEVPMKDHRGNFTTESHPIAYRDGSLVTRLSTNMMPAKVLEMFQGAYLHRLKEAGANTENVPLPVLVRRTVLTIDHPEEVISL